VSRGRGLFRPGTSGPIARPSRRHSMRPWQNDRSRT
jgi:hypothetical protein